MATILTDAVILANEYDLSGDSNNAKVEVTVADLDATTFGNTSVVRQAGLIDWNLAAEGFYSAASDAALSADVGANNVIAVAPANVDGGQAYVGTSLQTKYEISGAVGELAKFSLSAAGSVRPQLQRGTIALPRAVRTASGFGSNVQLGGIAAGQTLYAFVHVLGLPTGTAPTLNVVIQSSASAGFSSPTNQVTMNGLTAGATIGTKPGAVTDTYWRVSYVIGGTLPSFTTFVTLAIL